MNGICQRYPRSGSVIQLAISSLILALAPGCGDDQGSSGPTTERALEYTTDSVIVPSVLAFESSTVDLHDRVTAFCAAPDAPGLSSLQQAWVEVSLDWNQAVVYFFGPLRDDLIVPSMLFIESKRQRGRDFTETVREGIDAAVHGSEVLDATYFEGLPFDEVGLLALEILIFEDTTEAHSTEPGDVLSEYEAEPRKCEVLRGMSELLLGRARGVAEGWTSDFQGTGTSFRDRFVAGELQDGDDSTATLFVALLDHLGYVDQRKLRGTLDARVAGIFYDNLEATVLEVSATLEGGDGEGPSFFDVMIANGAESDVKIIREAVDVALQIATDLRSRQNMSDAVQALAESIRARVPPALDIDLGIEFADGD